MLITIELTGKIEKHNLKSISYSFCIEVWYKLKLTDIFWVLSIKFIKLYLIKYFKYLQTKNVCENAYLLQKIMNNKLWLRLSKCPNWDRRVFLSLCYYLMRSIEKILCPYRVKIVVFVVTQLQEALI